MSALVTEHFVLQSARSATVSESVGRAAVYLTCVSSSLVAFGFFAASTRHLVPMVATILPALIILGVFTFVRLVEISVENMVFLRRIEAIRRYYATLDPAAATFFGSADDGAAAALASTGMRAGITEMLFTGASMVAAVTSILAGAGAALLLDAVPVPVPAAVVAGIGVALLAFGSHMLWMYRRGRSAMALCAGAALAGAHGGPAGCSRSARTVLRRATCSPATLRSAWLSIWARGRTASRLTVWARTVTCSLL